MTKRLLSIFVLIFLLTLPVVWIQTQDSPRTPLIEITGVNTTELPTVFVNASVTDTLGQPVRGLGVADFALSGTFADVGRVVDVQNVTDDNLAFATTLVIDVSSSMAGQPFTRAQEAAIAFVNAVSAQDPIALVTFGNEVRLIVPPTTDKQALISAIQSLGFGGETALYDGSVLGVETAVTANLPRRAAIILSDGAEFGGNSANLRDAAQTRAIALGVPVYTIGLGFGADRSYLEALSTATNGRFYESPTPEQLPEIYAELAALFRSQYMVTLEADIPADGTEYTLGMQATTPQGVTNIAETTVRAPIPVPIVRAPESPAEPLTAPQTFTFEVLADDPLTSVTAQLGDAEPQAFDAAPYEITVDPFTFEPNDYTLTLNATDENGDTGSASVSFTVPPIPAQVSLDVDLAALGDIAEPVTFTVNSVGQTPTERVVASIDGVELRSVEGREFPTFTIDPATLPPGPHTLTVDVTSFSGAIATLEQAFSVAPLPPVVRLEGIEGDAALLGPTPLTFTVDSSQTPVTGIVFNTPGLVETFESPEGAVTFDLSPEFYPPAVTQTLTILVTEESGQVTEFTRTFSFDPSAYPTPTPTVDFAGTEAAVTQAAVIAETGTAVMVQATEAAVLATTDAQSTLDAQATADTVATNDAQATADIARATDAIMTQTADFALLATSDALATQNAVMTAVVQQTAESEVAAIATLDEQIRETNVAAASQTAQAATATRAIILTATAAVNVATEQSASVITTTADALNAVAQTATAVMNIATEQAAMTATDAAINALTATADADAALALTATDNALNALTATADADAALALTATDAAVQVAALNAQATADALATETADANVRITQTAEGVANATATAQAAIALTEDAELIAQATDAVEGATATFEAEIALTQTAEPTLTNTPPFDPTVTPGGVTDVEAQGGAPTIDNGLLLLLGGLGLLLLLILIFFLLRRRNKDQSGR